MASLKERDGEDFSGIQPMYTTSELDFKSWPENVNQAIENGLKNIDVVSNSLSNMSC